MKFTLSFDMSNSAFDDYPEGEAKRILRRVAEDIEFGFVDGDIKDINGNTIGQWDIEIEEDD